MSAFDSNRDGFINNLERQDAREFDRGDRNDDGALNRAEFARTDGKFFFCSSFNFEFDHRLKRSSSIQSIRYKS